MSKKFYGFIFLGELEMLVLFLSLSFHSKNMDPQLFNQIGVTLPPRTPLTPACGTLFIIGIIYRYFSTSVNRLFILRHYFIINRVNRICGLF